MSASLSQLDALKRVTDAVGWMSRADPSHERVVFSTMSECYFPLRVSFVYFFGMQQPFQECPPKSCCNTCIRLCFRLLGGAFDRRALSRLGISRCLRRLVARCLPAGDSRPPVFFDLRRRFEESRSNQPPQRVFWNALPIAGRRIGLAWSPLRGTCHCMLSRAFASRSGERAVDTPPQLEPVAALWEQDSPSALMSCSRAEVWRSRLFHPANQPMAHGETATT